MATQHVNAGILGVIPDTNSPSRHAHRNASFNKFKVLSGVLVYVVLNIDSNVNVTSHTNSQYSAIVEMPYSQSAMINLFQVSNSWMI